MNVPVNELKGIEAKVINILEELQTRRLPHTFIEQRRIYLIIESPIPSQSWSWKVERSASCVVALRGRWKVGAALGSHRKYVPRSQLRQAAHRAHREVVARCRRSHRPTFPRVVSGAGSHEVCPPSAFWVECGCICEWRRAARVVRASGARPCHRRPITNHDQRPERQLARRQDERPLHGVAFDTRIAPNTSQ